MSVRLCMAIVCVISTITCSNALLHEQEQISNNSLLVQFEYVVPKQWKDDIVGGFKQIIAKLSSDYCKEYPEYCNITKSRKIEVNNVIITPGYPQEKKGDTVLLFYVLIPLDARKDDEIVVPKVILNEMVKKKKDEISSVLRECSDSADSVSFRISYIEQELVRDTGGERLNMIIIPSAIGFLLLLLMLVMAVEWYRNRRQDDHLKQSMQDSEASLRKPSTSKDGDAAKVLSASTNGNICELPDVAITQ